MKFDGIIAEYSLGLIIYLQNIFLFVNSYSLLFIFL